MKKSDKKNLKIISAISVALFSLVTVFTATAAWFCSFSTVDGDGMDIKPISDKGRLRQVTVHECADIKNINSVYSFKREPSFTLTYNWGNTVTNKISVNMGEYSPLEPYKPLLFVFELSGEFRSTSASDFYIKGKTPVPGFLGDLASTGYPAYDLLNTESGMHLGTRDIDTNDDGVEETVGVYPLSSAVTIKTIGYSSDEYTSLLNGSSSSTIDIASTLVNSLDNKGFVNTNGSTISFLREKTFFSSTGNNQKISRVAMIVDYNGDAISAIYQTYLGDDTLEDAFNGYLCFKCDWNLEVY